MQKPQYLKRNQFAQDFGKHCAKLIQDAQVMPAPNALDLLGQYFEFRLKGQPEPLEGLDNAALLLHDSLVAKLDKAI